MTVDVLAIGAHPDDVELGVGGLIHRLIREGRSVAILDLTRGEMGTRGTPEERVQEALDAAHILGVGDRENAQLPDGALADTPEQQIRVIPFIRAFQPQVLLAPAPNDRHPDHEAAHRLVRSANFFAGLGRIETGHEPYRAPRLYYFPAHTVDAVPAFVADVSDTFDTKLEAVRAYRSQFHNPEYGGRETFISSPEFWESIRTRAVYWGGRVGVRYGEPLFTDGPVGISTLPGLNDAK